MLIRRFLLALAVIPLFLLAAGFLLQEIVFRGPLQLKLVTHRATMERHLEAFLDDQKELAALDVFAIDNRGKDAGTLLNPLVKWGAGTTRGARHLANAKSSPFALPATASALAADLEKLFDLAAGFDFTPYDLTWMKDALAFGYWDIHDAAPMREMFEQVRAGEKHMLVYLTSAPLPELKDMLTLAKVRLMKGIRERNPGPALAEVRHLAKLCYSTETLYGGLMAVALLGSERMAYDYAVSNRLLKAEDWKPIPPELHKRIKRTLFGAWGYFTPVTTPALLQRTYGSGQVTVGKCAGIREGTNAFSAIDRHVSPSFPLERDFRQVVDRLKAVATDPANDCRLKDIRAYWADPLAFRPWGFEVGAALSALGKDGSDSWIAAKMISYPLPYYRKASGLALAVLGIPATFGKYDEK